MQDETQKYQRILKKHGVRPDPDGLDDALTDYDKMAAEHGAMVERFMVFKEPQHTCGVYVCPACHRKIKPIIKYCGHCGQALSWQGYEAEDGERKNKQKGSGEYKKHRDRPP